MMQTVGQEPNAYADYAKACGSSLQQGLSAGAGCNEGYGTVGGSYVPPCRRTCGRCAHCGYCPCCGNGGAQWYPYNYPFYQNPAVGVPVVTYTTGQQTAQPQGHCINHYN